MRSFHWTLNWGKLANHMLIHLFGNASSPWNGRFWRKKDCVSIIILRYPKNAWKSMHTALPRGQHLEVLWVQHTKNFLLEQTKKQAPYIFTSFPWPKWLVYLENHCPKVMASNNGPETHKNIIKHRQQRLQNPFLPRLYTYSVYCWIDSLASALIHTGKKQCFPQLK